MPFRFRPLTLALALGWSSPLAGQVPDWVSQILVAADLPVSTAQARAEGAPNQEIKAALEAMMAQNIPASEARQIIDEERAARRENGPVDNFGAFVQAKLDAGLRGKELAAAIRAEHAARGKGKGVGQDKGKAEDRDRGKDEDRGRNKAGTRPGEAGDSVHGEKGRKDDRPGGRPGETPGKPGQSGKPENKGKPPAQPARPNR